MTRKDFNLIAVTMRNTWPRKYLDKPVDAAARAQQRLMQVQHKKAIFALARELDASYANFNYGLFCDAAGLPIPAGHNTRVIEQSLSVTHW